MEHKQVPCLDFHCDELLVNLLKIMNENNLTTIMSCQQCAHYTSVPHIWISMPCDVMERFLFVLNDPYEIEDKKSLSARIAREYTVSKKFEKNRCWKYRLYIDRIENELFISADVFFPFTDLEEVTQRLISYINSFKIKR